MVHLLRDGTSNHLIFAEECDVTSIASVEAFTTKWNEGQGNSGEMGGLGAGPAGDLSASTGMGAIGGGRGGGGGNQGQFGSGSSPRKLDTILFMPLDSTHYSIGDKIRKSREGLENSHAEILGRFHLINRMLPTLLLLPPHRDVRIISLVSPWYAAGQNSLDLQDLDFEKTTKGINTRFPSRSPWSIDGAQTCLWLCLSRELQRRIQVMTDADGRPRTKLPGIDDEGKISTNKITNVNVINICSGFERGRNVLDFLLPSRHEREEGAAWKEKVKGDNGEANAKMNTKGRAQELRKLVNPGSNQRSAKGKAEKDDDTQKVKQAIEENLPVSSFSLLETIAFPLQISLVILLWPFAWLLCKSPKRVAETVTWATVVPIFDGSQSFVTTKPGLFAVPGELHREGRLLR